MKQDKYIAHTGTSYGSHPSRPSEVNGTGAISNTSDYGPLINPGDGSGGSDTDTSRTDIRASTDGNPHTRASSVKRPGSFKPVTFAKISVSKSPGATQMAKSSTDKGEYPAYDRNSYLTFCALAPLSSVSSTPAQPSRPRLVAKTGSGLRDSTPASRSISGKSGVSAPDPSQVWNRNRRKQKFGHRIT